MRTFSLFIVLFIFPFLISGQLEGGNVWVVAANVYQYQDNGILTNLDYSSSGAYEFAQLYDSRQLTIESPEILVNRRATRESLIETLNSTFVSNPKISKDDLIIFYFSGHGGMAGNSIGVCPYDYTGDPRDLITDEEIISIMNKSIAKHKICFLEACKSKILKQDIYTPNILNSFNEKRKNIKGGLAFITSSEIGKETYGIAGESGHFTKYLISGLDGKADINKDKTVSIFEIYSFIQDGVKKESSGRQLPQINNGGFDPSMPVIIIPNSAIYDFNEPNKPVESLTKKSCEINQVGDVCLINNTEYNPLFIIVNDKILEIKKGEQECFYDVPVGIFKFKARESRPGGGSYCLGCYNSDFEVRVNACETATKKIN